MPSPLCSQVLRALSLAALLPRAGCWWATGHLAVAAVAQARLSPPAARAVTALLAIDTASYPLESSLPAAADWMDLIKAGTDAFSTWHYADAALVAASNGSVALDASWSPAASAALVSGGGAAPNVVWALTRCFSALAPGSRAAPAQRAWFLRAVLHLLGDMHQPLHCASLTLPGGSLDAGGNRAMLAPPARVADDGTTATNLHACWDAMAGAAAAVPATFPPLPAGGPGVAAPGLAALVASLAPEIGEAAAALAASKPALTASALTERTGAVVRAWHAESAALSAAAVYGGPPVASAVAARADALVIDTTHPGWPA